MLFNRKKNVIEERIEEANALFDEFKPEDAYQAFIKLENEYPDNVNVLFAVAVAQNSTRRQKLAIETLKKILTIDKTHEDTLCILPTVTYEYAVQLSENDEKRLAKDYLLDFIKYDNGNKVDLACGYKELASIEESFGNIEKAKEYLKIALTMDKDNKVIREHLNTLNGS
ncbi:MAG: hypothetical protein ABIN67_00695 [Ferruginibacter sp.]